MSNATPIVVVSAGPATPAILSSSGSASPVTTATQGQARPVIMVTSGNAWPIVYADLQPETVLWRDQVITNGGTVSDAQVLRVNTLITSLKTAGVWTLLDRLWLFASENIQQANLDIVHLAAGSANAGVTFTAARGWQGNGTSGTYTYAFNPALGGLNYTLNNAHMAMWDRIANNVTNGTDLAQDTSGHSYIYTNGGGAQLRWGVNNSGAAGNSVLANAGISTGWLHAQRYNATDVELLRNGASLQTATRASRASFVSANSVSFSGIAFANSQLSMISFGAAMTLPQAASYYTAVLAYMTDIGAFP